VKPASGIAFPNANLLALMLAGLAMLGPFAVDAYLPAFPNIGETLNASFIEVQQTLSIYMLSFAVMILWHGALSDAFGRRNIILGSLVVFAIASLGCAAAHSIEYLWAFRVLQGLSSGAGVVIGRAIIRDVYAGAEATRLLALVTMIFSIAPAIAPMLGGVIVEWLNWRAIFLTIFFYTVLLIWLCYQRLPETLPPHQRQPFNARELAANYRQILRSRLFHLKAGAIAVNFAGLFLYVAAAPVFITRHLGLGPSQFGWLFVPAVCGIFLGALAANRLAGKIAMARQVGLGFMFLIGAGIFNLGWHLFQPPSLPWSVAPLFFYTIGMSLVAPVLTLLVLDLFPALRGTAASCLGAIVAGLIAPVLAHSVLTLAAGQLGFAAAGLLLWRLARRARRRAGPAVYRGPGPL
jgi:MFS transporter, DHA1 family, multidrug resistance protein